MNCDATCDSARVRTRQHGAARNDRTRGHHSGYRGFCGDEASFHNGPRHDAAQKQAALAVEKELERVNGDIESFEGKLNKLTHLADMATITVQLQEKDKLGPLGYVFVGLWKGVRWLFVRGE